jgi:hypothetical protein
MGQMLLLQHAIIIATNVMAFNMINLCHYLQALHKLDLTNVTPSNAIKIAIRHMLLPQVINYIAA